jgi:glycolate oxidase iron-sulfur subunit
MGNSAFRWADAPDPDKFSQCVHCGLCLESCPTYQELGIESQSPRGRVYLIRAAAEGRIELNDSFAAPVWDCLDCRACETACPSGVQVGTLIEEARGQLTQSAPPSGLSGMISKAFLRGLFPHPKRMRRVGKLTRFYQKSGLQTAARGLGVLKLLPKHLQEMEAVLPAIPAKTSREMLPASSPAEGEKKANVALLTGCIMDVLFADINVATANVLTRNGCEVQVPEGQVCCGALQVHAGDREQAKEMARRNIDVFSASGADYVIVNVSGCGAALKEYPELLRHDEYLEKAEQFASRVRDISEFLCEIGFEPPAGRVEKKVTYHDACHLCHAQKIRTQPRDILQSIPGLELCEMADSTRCCGSAGIYNITHPEMAGALLDRKMADVPEGVEAIVMGNPGCMMQIAVGVNRTQMDAEVLHTVQLLDLAYQREKEGR